MDQNKAINDSTISSTSVMTGDNNKDRFLYYQLKLSIYKAKKIDIIVSFLMESGVRLILKDLKDALERGVSIRILTGNYLGITQPSALYLIKKELGERVDLRFYCDKERSFHPKAYIFHYDHESEIYIGSSNISRSALTSGIEWNYRFSSLRDYDNFELFNQTFLDLFNNHSVIIDHDELANYAKNWKKPAVLKDLVKYDDAESSIVTNVEKLYQPRGVQIEALYALQESRAEGATKGLIHAATGIGKTYLAAFDSVEYAKVLFVAHREEILNQARDSFCNVRKSEDVGFFNGKLKDTQNDVIFASVATLGRTEYLNERYFAKDYFDYIIIDEFHHAVNDQYTRIVEYFEPKFLLGLTATPERMDGKNIFEICDYNVPYEISLKASINRGILVPFHYYGIYDEVDYSSLRLVRGKYDEKDLNKKYIGNHHRYELIYKYYKKYSSKRALGFCCSREHAEEMAKEFCKRNIPSVAVYSNADGDYSMDREMAIHQLKNREIRVIFSVDMFNEGLDIAEVDMVLFLRPTQSPVVFLQQLGRGLRTCRGKEYLNVLDFIGNYEQAGNVRALLSGQSTNQKEITKDSIEDFVMEYPDECIVDFDFKLLDLFEILDKKKASVQSMILKEYYRVKETLNGKVPTRMELFTYMEDGIYQLCMNHSKENIFKNYLEFLHNNNELNELERLIYQGIGKEFLSLISTTNMQKVYKMPILYAFYNQGRIKLSVTEEDVLKAWKHFFNQGTNWKDFEPGITIADYRAMSDKSHLDKAKKMPIHHLIASGKGFFMSKDSYAIAIKDELSEVIANEGFAAHLKDILDYRVMDYYRRRYMEK